MGVGLNCGSGFYDLHGGLRFPIENLGNDTEERLVAGGQGSRRANDFKPALEAQ